MPNKADNDLGYGGAGGGVANWGGTFNMNGGTIIGNSSKESGGGVSNSPYFNDVKATFIMNGGKITGNEAQYGGGVSSTGNSAGNGKPAISSDFSVGGKASITDNSGKFGGGVYLGDSTMAVSGSANITNNKNGGTNSNVYLIDGKTMTVDNGFNGMIGVTAKNPAEELVVATGHEPEWQCCDEVPERRRQIWHQTQRQRFGPDRQDRRQRRDRLPRWDADLHRFWSAL